MDSPVKADSYGPTLNILCTELCIREVEESNNEFIQKHQDLVQLSHIPSWKFPYITIDKVDIFSMIDNCKSRDISTPQLYAELLEILLDRLCMSIMASSKILGSVGDIQDPTAPIQESPRKSKSRGDRGSGDSNKKDVSPRKPNIPAIMRQLHESISTVMESHMKLKRANSINRIQRKKASSLSLPGTCRAAGSEKTSEKTRHTVVTFSQTELSAHFACETCTVAQNLLKFLANSLSTCLSSMSPESSEISKIREGNTVWKLSQREFLLRWCEALRADSNMIAEKGKAMLEEKKEMEKEFKVLKTKCDSDVRTKAVESEELSKKMKSLEDGWNKEKAATEELQGKLQAEEIRYKELETQLQRKKEECSAHNKKVVGLTDSLQKINNLHKRLHETHTNSEKVKGELEERVGSLNEKVAALEKSQIRLEAQLEVKNEDIDKLDRLLEKFRREEAQKDEIKVILEKAKRQLEACKKTEEEKKKERAADKEQLERLQGQVLAQKEQIELLTLYPDLNGPINPPTDIDGEDPLQAMAQQVQSNELRIQILSSQTAILKATLDKYKNHLSTGNGNV